MNPLHWMRVARPVALFAGAMDFLTGLGLVFDPVVTLRLMFVPPPADAALVYVRFVGAFVAAVGASYLIALLRGGSERLREVFASTTVFRLAAGLFTGVAVATHQLSPPWLLVTATDLALVVGQQWLLRQQDSHDV